MPADFPNYMHHSRLLEYFRLYADHFRLAQYIRFETEVVSVERRPDGGGQWTVVTRKTTDRAGDAVTQTFDCVLVCVGIHSSANMPSFQGQDDFEGELIHSTKYRQASWHVHRKQSNSQTILVSDSCLLIHRRTGQGAGGGQSPPLDLGN